MRSTAMLVLLLALALASAVLVAGCSGVGAPAQPGGQAALRGLAEDQVTALLLIKQWFPVLYPAPGPQGSCKLGFEVLPLPTAVTVRSRWEKGPGT